MAINAGNLPGNLPDDLNVRHREDGVKQTGCERTIDGFGEYLDQLLAETVLYSEPDTGEGNDRDFMGELANAMLSDPPESKLPVWNRIPNHPRITELGKQILTKLTSSWTPEPKDDTELSKRTGLVTEAVDMLDNNQHVKPQTLTALVGYILSGISQELQNQLLAGNPYDDIPGIIYHCHNKMFMNEGSTGDTPSSTIGG